MKFAVNTEVPKSYYKRQLVVLVAKFHLILSIFRKADTYETIYKKKSVHVLFQLAMYLASTPDKKNIF